MGVKRLGYKDLDGHLLEAFLVILEHSSVSRAADKLHASQSTASQWLAKLRQITGDPLFVRSGNELVPTQRALELKPLVEDALEALERVSLSNDFDPSKGEHLFRIASNDMQRDILFPVLLRNAKSHNSQVRLEFRPAEVPGVDLIRDPSVHLTLTPMPPDASDIFVKKLLVGNLMVFFDSAERSAPETVDAYLQSEHIGVRFPNGRSPFDVVRGDEALHQRNETVVVTTFNEILPFVKGSARLSTAMDMMHLAAFSELTMAPLPFESESVTLFMVWHERYNTDPAHKWLREQVELAARDLTHRIAKARNAV